MKLHNVSSSLRHTRTKLTLALVSILAAVTVFDLHASEHEQEGSKIVMQGLSKEQKQIVADAKKAQGEKSYSDQERAAIELAIGAVKEQIPVSKDLVSHLRIRSMQWPDSSLGCSEEGMSYLQKVTVGYMVSFTFDEKIYTVHVGDDSAVVCDQFNDRMKERQKRAQSLISVYDAARVNLAEKLMVDPEKIELTKIKQETWPDSSLGCPITGQQYLQKPVKGFIINMSCSDKQYEYRVPLKGGDFISCKEIVSCHETE